MRATNKTRSDTFQCVISSEKIFTLSPGSRDTDPESIRRPPLRYMTPYSCPHEFYIFVEYRCVSKPLGILMHVDGRGQEIEVVSQVLEKEVKEERNVPHPSKSFTPSNDSNLETDFPQLLSVQKHPSIKHESGLVHAIINRLPVDVAELLPLCRDHNSLGLCAG